eukprot:5621689-Prymnesium_polylepis.2
MLWRTHSPTSRSGLRHRAHVNGRTIGQRGQPLRHLLARHFRVLQRLGTEEVVLGGVGHIVVVNEVALAARRHCEAGAHA